MNWTLSFDMKLDDGDDGDDIISIYDTVLNNLAQHFSVFWHPNVNVFIFGNSYLRQIFESLLCMIYEIGGNNLTDLSKIVNIFTGYYSEDEYNTTIDHMNEIEIPCMTTINDKFGNALVQEISKHQYKNWTHFVNDYLLINKSTMQLNKLCETSNSILSFIKSNSNIFYTFQHKQKQKSLLFEFKKFANYYKVDLSLFISNINVIIMNRGNNPSYNIHHKLIKELKEIIKYRHKHDKTNNNQLLLILTDPSPTDRILGHTLKDEKRLNYAFSIENEIKKLNISYMIINMAQIIDTIKMNLELSKFNELIITGHWCMPGMPSHLLLFYINAINTMLTLTNNTITPHGPHLDIT